MAGAEAKKSDLPARVGSALVMVAVAGTALWLGGLVWTAFVLAVAAGVLWEWVKLANAITPKFWARVLWLVGGVVYIGVAALVLIRSHGEHRIGVVLPIIAAVIATDVGAYFAGRLIGGPKIAPSISPSKTWSGLLGGIVMAGVVLFALSYGHSWLRCSGYSVSWEAAQCWGTLDRWLKFTALMVVALGAVCAVVAQAGDFFESWMKRRAGVKDSGNILPGHGGLFDRVDGLLAVCFVLPLIALVLHL